MSVTYDDDLMMMMSSGIASIIEASPRGRQAGSMGERASPFFCLRSGQLVPEDPRRFVAVIVDRSRSGGILSFAPWYWGGRSEARPHFQRDPRLRAFSALGEPPAPSESPCSPSEPYRWRRPCAPAAPVCRPPIISLSSLSVSLPPPPRPSIHIMPSGRGNLIHLRPPLSLSARAPEPLPSLARVPILRPEA